MEENGNVQVLEDSIKAAPTSSVLCAKMEADQQLNEFYSQECLLEGKRKNHLLKRKWLDLALKTILDSVDMTIHTTAEEYLQKGRATLFVFGTGADFKSSSGRPLIHSLVEKEMIKKVLGSTNQQLRALGHQVVGMDEYRTSQ